MKKTLSIILAICLITTFALFAMASGESEDTTKDQGTDSVNNNDTSKDQNSKNEENKNDTLGDYKVEIVSCRLAKDYSGKDVVIIKYNFTNEKNDTPTSFMIALNDQVYQAGVGLNEAFIIDDSYNYSADNQTKEIKQGYSLEVEVAYELNDITTEIEVEVSELISFNKSKITKKFSLV